MNPIETIEAHTAGEPLRIITSGFPQPPGATMLQRRAHARRHLDRLRRMVMLEPRGHADMYGALLTPPATVDGDVGVLFMHNEGFSTMCGHGIIALTKVGLERGLFEADPDCVRIDTPAGRVVARAELDDGRVERVSFVNVPSFVDREVCVDVAGVGAVEVTVAYGGAYYAYVDAQTMGLDLEATNVGALIEHGMAVKRAVASACDLRHPGGDDDLGVLYGTIFVGPRPGVHSRNVCVFAEGEVDRSPTGTGVSGRAAILHARGERLRDWVTIESILGTSFEVRVAAVTDLGGRPAVRPEVRGRAFVTGEARFSLDPSDPIAAGFLLR